MISVIIPHYTGGGKTSVLKNTIDSILVQSIAPNTEVIVVCNPPDSESGELQSLYGARVKVLSSPEANVNVARNLGLRHARGQYSVFLDDDCVLGDKSSLEKILSSLERDPNLIACGGDYQLPEKSKIWDLAYSRIQRRWIQASQLPDKTSENLFGGFLAVKSGELKGIDFEESIPFGGAELSFVHRLRETGKKVRWFEDVKVTHLTRLSFFQFLRKGYKQGLTTGRFPQLGENKVLRAKPHEKKYFADALYQLSFDYGRIAADRDSRKILRRLHSLKTFIFEFLGPNKIWRNYQELRAITELYRRKLF
jgi:glycosyltransferase involved in cell wall biosynthesis